LYVIVRVYMFFFLFFNLLFTYSVYVTGMCYVIEVFGILPFFEVLTVSRRSIFYVYIITVHLTNRELV